MMLSHLGRCNKSCGALLQFALCQCQNQNVFTMSKRRQLALHSNGNIDYYSVLEVSPKASQKQIKAAYYKLSKQLHPDMNIGAKTSHDKMAQVTAAYDILGNAESRKSYDRTLLVAGQGVGKISQTRPYSQQDIIRHKESVAYSSAVNYDNWTKAHYTASLDSARKQALEDRLRREIRQDEKQVLFHRFAVLGSFLLLIIFSVVLVKRPRQASHENKLK